MKWAPSTHPSLLQVVVTDTVPLRNEHAMKHIHKISQLSVAPLLAEAILRMNAGESLQLLRVFDRENVEERYKSQSVEER